MAWTAARIELETCAIADMLACRPASKALKARGQLEQIPELALIMTSQWQPRSHACASVQSQLMHLAIE
jgi:hypothetical protein